MAGEKNPNFFNSIFSLTNLLKFSALTLLKVLESVVLSDHTGKRKLNF